MHHDADLPAPPGPSRPSRIGWIDVARGIGILLVVYGHAQRSFYARVASPPHAYLLTDRILYSFHMPLFFMLSGLFLWPSLSRGRRLFVVDKVRTIVYPYFLWSLIEGGLVVALPNDVHMPLTLNDLALIPIVPIEQYWFLYALFLCQLVALACYPRRAVLIAAAIAGVLLAGLSGVGSAVRQACMFLPYVAIGVIAADRLAALAASPRAAAAAGIIAAAAFIICSALPIGSIGVGLTYLAGIAGSVMTYAVARLIAASQLGAILATLGRASMAIYLMHTIFSAGTGVILHHLPVVPDMVVTIAATTLAGIIAPLIIWAMAERAGLGGVLGIGSGRRGSGLGGNAAVNGKMAPLAANIGTK